MNPTIERYNATGKILIVDNYIDRSAAIAKDCGVRAVSETRSVYGLAVFSRPETGMWNDHGNVIIFCDCDSTYVFQSGFVLSASCRENQYDFIIGDRFAGEIEVLGSRHCEFLYGLLGFGGDGRYGYCPK